MKTPFAAASWLLKMASRLVLFLLCVAVTEATAQRKSVKQYVHDTWTTANGLPQNGADDIIQTRDGYLWFATQEGLTRFDGVEFSVFDKVNTSELSTSWIIRLLEDSLGGLWIRPQGVAPGLVRYANGTFKTYRRADGLPSDRTLTWVAGPEGSVWIGTDRGLVEWKDGTFTKFSRTDGLPSDTVDAIGVDRNNTLWISTPGGFAKLSGGTIETLTGKKGFADTNIVRINGVTNIFEDNRGALWMSSPGKVISYVDGVFNHYSRQQGVPDSVITSIAQDRQGTIWIGTSRGLARFSNGMFTPMAVSADRNENDVREMHADREGNLWLGTAKGIARYASGKLERFDQKDGLTGNSILKMLIDKEGSVWSSSEGGGVDRFRDEKFSTYSTRVGLSNDIVSSVFEDRSGAIWVGTLGGGVNRIKDNVISVFDKKNGLPGNTIRSIGEDPRGTVLFVTDGGVAEYKNGVLTTVIGPEQMRNIRATASLIRRSGEVILGSGRKLFTVRGTRLVPYNPVDSVFNNREDLFSFIETSVGSLWICTLDSVFQYTGGKLVNFTAEHHLPAVGANFVAEYPDGTIWLGTIGEGLFRYKNGKVSNVTPRQGLFDYSAFSFIEDRLGHVWMSSNRGVYRVVRQELEEVADGTREMLTSVVYGTADGMESRECNGLGSPTAFRTSDGRICYTTVKGVAIVNPQDIRINTVPPPVVIDRFLVEGERQPLQGPIRIPPGKARFEFHYAGLSFVGADQMRYKYQLAGLDKEWIDAGSHREAYYTHIDPGEYTFRVISANSDGIWNETGASVSFTLQPRFYETSWFLGLGIFLFVTIGPSFYLYRMRNMKKRRAELEEQVKERTSELQKTLDNLKDTQNQLILSEKMASLGQLTAGIAHEIKNPLNFITNFAVLSHDLTKDLRKELLAERNRVDPNRAQEIQEILNDLEQNVSKINEHGKRADSIVRGMLLHSRGKAGERQETDLNALLAEYTNLAYHGMRAQDQSFNVKIETDLDPTIGKVSVVPQDLSRAFLNIVNNACYAAYDKRKSAKNGFSPAVKVSARNFPDNVEIRIRDNGNGIPRSIREKIFNPFFTTKPAGAGTGLGLSLSYDIITQGHKGEIQVDTREGEYTEFVITLPKNPDTNGGTKS